jgi:hypothetical protein
MRPHAGLQWRPHQPAIHTTSPVYGIVDATATKRLLIGRRRRGWRELMRLTSHLCDLRTTKTPGIIAGCRRHLGAALAAVVAVGGGGEGSSADTEYSYSGSTISLSFFASKMPRYEMIASKQ